MPDNPKMKEMKPEKWWVELVTGIGFINNFGWKNRPTPCNGGKIVQVEVRKIRVVRPKPSRRSTVADIMKMLPDEWDKRPFSLASEIRSFLASVKDEGTSIDSGTDGVTGDLWVTVQGVSYTVCVFKTGSVQMCAAEKSNG